MNKITIAEFAKRQGISKAKAYAMADDELREYVSIEEGIKRIDIDRLEQRTDNRAEDRERKETQETASREEEYRQEIDRLREEIREERKLNIENHNKLLELTDRVIKLTENTQILMARIQEQQLLIQQEQKPKLIEEEARKKRRIFDFFRRK